MTAGRWLGAAIAIALTTASATADPVPSLVFQSDPAAKGAKLKAGFDLTTGAPIERVISPFFQTTTDSGISNLFSISASGESTSAAWQLGATVTWVNWRPDPVTERAGAGNNEDYRLLERGVYDICRALCDDAATKLKSGPFCDARTTRHQLLRANAQPGTLLASASETEKATDKAASDAERAAGADPAAQARALMLRQKANAAKEDTVRLLDEDTPASMEVTDYCPSGKPTLISYLRRHYAPWSSVPSRVVSVGGSAGLTTHTFLRPAGSSYALDEDKVHTTQAVAGSAAWIWPGFSVELPVMFERRFRAPSSTTARWCEPVGDVEIAGGTSPAETCKEQPVGRPSRAYTVKAAAYAGALAPASFWRVAAGLSGEVTFDAAADSDDDVPFKVGIQVPFYVGTRLLKSDAKGLVRLSIGAFYARAADGSDDTSVSLTIAVLSSPTLFPGAFEQF
jgi:hypothetical protein